MRKQIGLAVRESICIMLVICILLVIGLILFIKFYFKFKSPKVGAIALVTGGVKTGKSAVSVGIALSNYKRSVFNWKISCILTKFVNCFKKREKRYSMPERPLLYSNIPLRYVNYIPLTTEHLLRQKRLAYKSVVLIDEASLVADSMLVKNNVVNLELLLFFKLFGHETKGGLAVVNSHNITDLHFALKRTTSQYFYIHHLTKFIPFFVCASMREERFSDDNSVVNVYQEDLEESLKLYLMPKKVFKKYDSYCFSALTDDLPVDTYKDTIRKGKYHSLKSKNIVSFRKEIDNLNKEFLCEKEI